MTDQADQLAETLMRLYRERGAAAVAAFLRDDAVPVMRRYGFSEAGVAGVLEIVGRVDCVAAIERLVGGGR